MDKKDHAAFLGTIARDLRLFNAIHVIRYFPLRQKLRPTGKTLVGSIKTFLTFLRECDVDSTHPGAEAGSKGSVVRRLKSYVSWV